MRYLPALLLATLSGFFAWLFYERYWNWRDCIRAAVSSCVTPEGDNLLPAGAMWSIPAGLFLILAVAFAWSLRRR
jgi:hypothetical protein